VPAPPATYAVDLSPADFVPSVTNVYFPLVPGSSYAYEAETGEGLERTEIEVLAGSREVMGLSATVVHDVVTLDGQLIEDTYDWYAQDRLGNVWYLGEDVSNYEDAQFVDKAGSWEAGIDGALPGIIMFGDPSAHVGETYRQEYYQGQAEDMADLLNTSENATVPFGSFSNVIKTRDYTPLEPDLKEEKYYASGIGPIKTVNLTTGEEDVLIEFTSP
jgi:hypothetical protein